MGLKNIDRTVLKNPSNFRKLSMGNWGGIGDPQVYALLDLDCTKALEYMKKVHEESGTKVTVNHLIGKIMALALKKYPQLNAMIANGKIYLRNQVDIFFQVGIENAETELVGICIKQADQKGIVEFAKEVAEKSEKVKSSKNHPMRKNQMPFRYLPWRSIPYVLRFLNWVQFDWNLNLSWLGIPKDPFGSLMITSIGTLGMEMVFVPLTHIGRTPAQIAVGKIEKKVVVVQDSMVIRPHLNLCCTFDHRFMDGVLASKLARYLTEIFENIDRHVPLVEGKITLEEDQETSKKEESSDGQ